MNKWNKKSELTNPMGFWLCIGSAVGVSLGFVAGNFVLGIGLGITAGVLVGVSQQKRQKSMDADHEIKSANTSSVVLESISALGQ